LITLGAKELRGSVATFELYVGRLHFLWIGRLNFITRKFGKVASPETLSSEKVPEAQ